MLVRALIIALFISGCGAMPKISVNPIPPNCGDPHDRIGDPANGWAGAICDVWDTTYGWETETQLFVLFDENFDFVERMSCGNTNSTTHASCPARVVSGFFRNPRARFIMHWHNHTAHAVKPTFSQGDLKAYKRISELAAEAGIEFVDAIVMLPGRLTSARHERVL